MDQSVSCSIIIPVHNGASTLGRCLDALAAQIGVSVEREVIVVDDASTDGTAEVAQAHGVRVVTLPAQQGPAAARNAGAAAARGEVLLFIDADCEAVDDWCQQMLRPLADPQVCGTYGAYRTRQTAWVARLAQAEFDDVNMTKAQFHNINMSDIAVSCVQMGGAKFKHIGLPPGSKGKQRPLSFEEADLNGTTISKCDLSNVKIVNCNVEGMTIDGVPVTKLMAAYKQKK